MPSDSPETTPTVGDYGAGTDTPIPPGLPFVPQSDPRIRRHECLDFVFRTLCCECEMNEVIVWPHHNASDTNCTTCQEDT